MNLSEFQKINAARATRWHQGDLNHWTLLEWAGAMCGEAGEAANVAKKIRRITIGLPNKESGLTDGDLDGLRTKFGKEVADTIIYGLICLSAIDFDATEVIAAVFDHKSMEYGFPERAPFAFSVPPITNRQEAAEAFAMSLGVSRRFNGEIHLGGHVFTNITEVVRYAFLAGANSVEVTDGTKS